MESIFLDHDHQNSHNHSLTDEEQAELETVRRNLKIVFLSVPFILLAFGIPGNVLTIMVLRVRSMKDNIFSYYLVSMCSFNLLTLMVNLPRYINKGLTGKEVNFTSKNLCAFYRYCSTTLVAISDWHLVVITGARLFFLLDRSKRYTYLYSSPFSVIFTLCLVMVLFEVPSVGFWIRFRDEMGNPVECYLPGDSPLVHLQLCIQTLVPAALLICLNVFILHIHRSQESGLIESHATSTLRKRLLVLVFLSNFQFIVSVLPLTIVYPNMRFFFDMSNPLGKAESNLTFGAVALLLYSTYATDFLVYAFFGRKFRKELFKLLHPVCSWVLPQRLDFTEHSTTDLSDGTRPKALSLRSPSILQKKSATEPSAKTSTEPAIKPQPPSEKSSVSSFDEMDSPPILRNFLRWSLRPSVKPPPMSGETLY